MKRGLITYLFGLTLGFLILVSFGTYATDYYGYVAYNNKTVFEDANVSLEIYNMTNEGPNLTATYSNLTGSDGLFNLTNITIEDSEFFQVKIKVYNESNPLFVDWVGPTMPTFPAQEFNMTLNTTFYLKQGATINVSAVNGTGDPKTFQYQVKDTRMGHPIESSFISSQTNVLIHVPAERNYSVMIYPNESFPVSVDVDSLSLTTGYFEKVFNCTESNGNRLTGYLTANGNTTFDSIDILYYLLEPGRMIFIGENSWVMNNFTLGEVEGDNYNLTSGFYNISLLGTVENASVLLMAVASRDGDVYGGFQEIILSYTGPKNKTGDDIDYAFNMTLYEFVGSYYNVTTNGGGYGSESIQLKGMNLSLIYNGTALEESGSIEVELDYEDYNMTNFTFMKQFSSDDNGVVQIPMLNMTGAERINVYTSQAAPTKKMLNSSQVNDGQVDITLRENMDMKKPDGAEFVEDLFIDMTISSDECTVPNYNASVCSFIGDDFEEMDEDFNPMKIILSGASMNFVMTTEGIQVIYVNVDLFASGPPDAIFDDEAEDDESGDTFEQAWRFGSTGPEIYDYVIIGVPYTEGSSSETGFNESANITVEIPYLYGEDFDTPLWDGSESNVTDIENDEDLKDFRDYLDTDYETYLNGTGVYCNESDSNLSSGLCYKDTTNNMIWFKIKHFSGLGPNIAGDVITADTVARQGSSGGSSPGTNYLNVELSEESEEYVLNKEGKLTFSFKESSHKIELTKVVLTASERSATLTISSTPQTLTLKEGEGSEVDVDGDSINDIFVELVKINSFTSVNLTISELPTLVKTKTPEIKEQVIANEKDKEVAELTKEEKLTGNYSWIVALVAIVLVILLIVLFSLKTHKRR